MADDLLSIIEETDDWLIVNKPGGLVCHPTKGDSYSSLIGRLRLYYESKPEVKPSFVNRLDRETSGIVVIAKKPAIHAALQKEFDARKVEKTYWAIVHGIPKDKTGWIDQPLGREPGAEVVIKQAVLQGGAPSQTNWVLLKSSVDEKYSLLEVKPSTGRLHQIRVHLSWLGHSIVGDKLYGPDSKYYLEFIETGWTPRLEEKLQVSRQMLHAASLKFQFRERELNWKAPIPSDMINFQKQIGL